MSWDRWLTYLSELMRRAVRDLFAAARTKPWMRYAGFVESGNPRSSQSIDEVVYDGKH